jgi:hypothetical protein
MEQNKALNWDDEIVKDSGEFTLLPEGDYTFKVVNFERAWYDGSDKIPPCNKAIITIKIEAPEGTAELKENLFLTTKTEGLLSAFFSSIGQKKKGEPLRMNWNKVIGSTGRVKVTNREYNDSTYNQVKRWLSPEEPKSAGGFKPGAF